MEVAFQRDPSQRSRSAAKASPSPNVTARHDRVVDDAYRSSASGRYFSTNARSMV
jgi:hypothetical protein